MYQSGALVVKIYGRKHMHAHNTLIYKHTRLYAVVRAVRCFACKHMHTHTCTCTRTYTSTHVSTQWTRAVHCFACPYAAVIHFCCWCSSLPCYTWASKRPPLAASSSSCSAARPVCVYVCASVIHRLRRGPSCSFFFTVLRVCVCLHEGVDVGFCE